MTKKQEALSVALETQADTMPPQLAMTMVMARGIIGAMDDKDIDELVCHFKKIVIAVETAGGS